MHLLAKFAVVCRSHPRPLQVEAESSFQECTASRTDLRFHARRPSLCPVRAAAEGGPYARFLLHPIRQCGLVTTGGRGGSGLASGCAWLWHIERQHGTWSCDWSYLSATDPAETLSRRYHRHLDRHIRWNAPHPCLRPLPSRHHPGTCFSFAWTSTMSTFNLAVQVSAPSWVQARALGIYQMVFSAGMSLGSVVWGLVADTRYDKCLTCRGRRWSVRYAADDTPVARAAR